MYNQHSDFTVDEKKSEKHKISFLHKISQKSGRNQSRNQFFKIEMVMTLSCVIGHVLNLCLLLRKEINLMEYKRKKNLKANLTHFQSNAETNL
ncbi:CLUMA_CG003121, isoform A [Clunio marinus]|uniref:CLUMA_CG003121, isoform A n=1 Tax=Clunio marinus TaxID=568069 RepID=A0A1J1HMU1_9DIPT|nr:CLUMA_CG003121, isoform A [Clunio marinus]